MRYVFIINPVAGKDKGKEKLSDAIKNFFKDKDLEFSISFSDYRGNITEIARSEAEKGDDVTIFACGGEGTSFEVLNGIYGYDNAVMGVIPCGSANDFLRFFDCKDSFLDLKQQLEGETVSMDIIRAGDKYCLNGCSVGMDAIVAKNMILYKNLPFVSGGLAYKLAIIKAFLGKIGLKLKLKLDNTDLGERDCLFAVISNAPFYGGGFMGAPDAIPNDNILNFTLVDTISRLKILRFLPVYEKGKHRNLSFCTMKECSKLEIESDLELPINLDGEVIMAKSFDFELIKNGIKFLLPKKALKKLALKV